MRTSVLLTDAKTLHAVGPVHRREEVRHGANLPLAVGARDAVRLGRALGAVQEARALASDLQSAALHFMARPARSDLDELRASLDRTQRRLDRMERYLNERND